MATREEILTQIEARLTLYIAAEAAILGGAQSYSIGNRTLTRADLFQIQKTIRDLYGDRKQLETGNKLRDQRVVPRDI